MSDERDEFLELVNPSLRRLRERERRRLVLADEARGAIRRAGRQRPDDLAAPPGEWTRMLEGAIDTLLRAEWPHESTSPDGVSLRMLTATADRLEVDAVLHLLPSGRRLLRLEFRDDGNWTLRVAEESETAHATRRHDPRRPLRWEFSLS